VGGLQLPISGIALVSGVSFVRAILRWISYLSVIAVVGVVLPIMWIQSHPLLPGQRGCSMVQRYDARYQCYADAFQGDLNGKNPAKFLASLDRKAIGNSRFENDCHEAMHVATRRLVREDKVDPMKLLTSASGLSNCTRGVQHGLLMATADLEPAVHKRLRTKLCVESKAAIERFNCYHGLGHVFVQQAHGDVRAGADECWKLDGLGDRAETVDGCLDGAFMERAFKVTAKDPAKAFADVCTRARPRELVACQVQAASVFTVKDRLRKSEDSLKVCARLKDEIAAAGCYTGTAWSVKLDQVAYCSAVQNDALAARCAMHVATRASETGQANKLERACRRAKDDAVNFGCGAVMVQHVLGRSFEPSKVKDQAGIARITSACAKLASPFTAGCVARALNCWPNEDAAWRAATDPVRKACDERAASLEDLQLHVAGEPMRSVNDPSFDAWYTALEQAHPHLPRGT
jgi:hypothetical protein